MVVHRPRLFRPRGPRRADQKEVHDLTVKERAAGDDYWKVGLSGWPTLMAINAFLVEHRYPPRRDRNEGLCLAERADRGLLYYGDKRLPVLRQFVRNRAIVLDTSTRLNVTQIIEALKEADDSALFESFTKLPAEMRVRIYEFYFAWLATPENPTQPPICKSSSLIRTESLPVFYSTCNFKVTTSIFHSIPTLNNFTLRTSAINLSYITNFTIHMRFGPTATPYLLEVDLCAKADTTSKFRAAYRQWYGSTHDAPRAKALIKRFAARPGARKLMLADIREICQALRFESLLVGGP